MIEMEINVTGVEPQGEDQDVRESRSDELDTSCASPNADANVNIKHSAISNINPGFLELCVTASNISIDSFNPVSSCCVLSLRDDPNSKWREQARTEVVANNNSPAYATWLSIPLKSSKHLVNYWYKLQILQIDGAMRYSSFRAISARAANNRSGNASQSESVILEVKEHVSNLCHHQNGTRMEKSLPGLRENSVNGNLHDKNRISFLQKNIKNDRRIAVSAFFGMPRNGQTEMPGGTSDWVRLEMGASGLPPHYAGYYNSYVFWQLEIFRQAEGHDGTFDLIHRSKPIRGSKIVWDSFVIPMRWCKNITPTNVTGDEWLDIKINLCECTSSGQCVVVGQTFTKLGEILQKSTAEINDNSTKQTESLKYANDIDGAAVDNKANNDFLRLMNVANERDILEGSSLKIDIFDCRIFSKCVTPIKKKRPKSAFPSSTKRNLIASSLISSSGLPSSHLTTQNRPTSMEHRRDKALQADLECLTNIMKDEVCLRSPDLKALVEDRIYRLEEMFQETTNDDEFHNQSKSSKDVSVSGKPIVVTNSPGRRAQSAPSRGRDLSLAGYLVSSQKIKHEAQSKNEKQMPLLPKRILRYELNTPSKRMSSVEYIKMLEMMDRRQKAPLLDTKKEFRRSENLFGRSGYLKRSESMLSGKVPEVSNDINVIAAIMNSPGKY